MLRGSSIEEPHTAYPICLGTVGRIVCPTGLEKLFGSLYVSIVDMLDTKMSVGKKEEPQREEGWGA